jgi:hypothetical protein
MSKKLLIVLPFAVLLSACSTYTTPRYAINADTNVALKAIGASNVAVGTFTGPSAFDPSCRAAGPLAPPDGITHTAYLKKALEDELKVAGAYSASSPKVILTGAVNKLEFSSSRGLTGGSWDIDVSLNSSNGKSMAAVEHYEFESGFVADTACKQTAEAYMPTVQNLIGKIVRSPEFKGLLQ